MKPSVNSLLDRVLRASLQNRRHLLRFTALNPSASAVIGCSYCCCCCCRRDHKRDRSRNSRLFRTDTALASRTQSQRCCCCYCCCWPNALAWALGCEYFLDATPDAAAIRPRGSSTPCPLKRDAPDGQEATAAVDANLKHLKYLNRNVCVFFTYYCCCVGHEKVSFKPEK